MKIFRNHLAPLVIAIVGFMASFCHSTAQADLITFAYEGTIDHASGGAAFDAFLGETIRFEYTFESTTADSDPDPTLGFYQDPTGALTLTVGSSIYSSGIDINVANNFFAEGDTIDDYSVDAAGPVTGPLIGGAHDIAFTFRMLDFTHTAFNDDSLPLIQPNPGSFDFSNLGIDFLSDGGFVGGLRTSSFAIASVPEPSSFAFFSLLGLVTAGFRARRR